MNALKPVYIIVLGEGICHRLKGQLTVKAAIPLYQQVIDIIKNEINSGAYKAGARIPNEFELAESYKVGRVTVRRAIEELVQQGLSNEAAGERHVLSMPPSLSARFARRMTSRVFGRMSR